MGGKAALVLSAAAKAEAAKPVKNTKSNYKARKPKRGSHFVHFVLATGGSS